MKGLAATIVTAIAASLVHPIAVPAQPLVVPTLNGTAGLATIQERQRAYFADRGTGQGSGYRQYKRWEWFAAPRNYPSDKLVNTTALAWLNDFRAQRSDTFTAAAKLALASGVGNGAWRLVGPTRYVRGQSGYNGGIGRINAIAFHPTQPSTFYVGAPVGGLWRTQDGGTTWMALTDGLPVVGVSDIAIDPSNPDTIYLLTGDGDGRNVPSMGVVKSTDGGRTWQATGLTWARNDPQHGYRLAMHPAAPTVLLAATTDGLIRTDDGGVKWDKVDVGNLGDVFFDVVFHPTNPSIAYAATPTRVYKSTDAGKKWNVLGGGLPSSPVSDRIRLAVAHNSPDTLYVLYGAPKGFGFAVGLYRSDDGGRIFSLQSNSPNILGYDTNGNDTLSQSGYDLAMAISPTNVDRVHVGGINTWRSDDGGKKWRITSHWEETGQPSYTHGDIHTLAYHGNDLFAGTDGGLYRSRDGGATWVSLTVGMSITMVNTLCSTPQDANLVYFGAQDNGSNRYQLNGQSMTQVFGADGFVCQIHPRDSRMVYISSQNGELYRSIDGGNTFGNTVPPPPISPPVPRDQQGTLEAAWLTPYRLDPSAPSTIYACYADLWRSTNGGGQWQNLTAGLIEASRECRQVVIAPTDPKTLYVAKGPDDRLGFKGGVYRSTNGGTINWDIVTGTLPVDRAAITNLAVSPTDSKRIWVTFSGYDESAKVYTSTNGGTMWTNLSVGLPNLPVNAVAAQNDAAHGVYIGLDVGVYYRNDNLPTWIPFMNGLPNTVIQSLMIDEARQRIFAATYGRGIWQSGTYSPCPVAYDFSPNTAPTIVGVTVYQASNVIRSTIALPASITVDVSYRAGRRVYLAPGFTVGRGARFNASIGPCQANVASAPPGFAPPMALPSFESTVAHGLADHDRVLMAAPGVAVTHIPEVQSTAQYTGPLGIFE
jgi:photosystem II stability/assembly factor-like uncharacterized protein